jgi:hypothetical protein
MQAGGDNPFAGMGDAIRSATGGGAQAGPAQGDLKVKFDTVKRVLEEAMSGMAAGRELVSRAMQLLDQALVLESQKGPGTPPTAQPEQGGAPGGVESLSRPPAPAFAG